MSAEPGTAPLPAAPNLAAPAEGAIGWIASTDHKRTAAKVGAASLVFFIASGVLALVMRTELAQPGLQFISDQTYNELFSMHGSGMIFLFLTPAALALGLYFVPLQIGAAEIALPRLALFGFWTYLCGGLTMYAGFFTDNGAGSDGWTAAVPLSNSAFTPGIGMDMWVIGAGLSARC